MANFEYTAKNAQGALLHGVITASDRSSGLSSLRQRGLVPVLIKPAKAKTKVALRLPFIKQKVKAKDLVVMTRQLSTMINAGVPIVRSLHTLQTQTTSPRLKEILGQVVPKVEGGSPLSEALQAHPETFSAVYVNMVKAGETGGILDQILDRLAGAVEKDADLKGKVRGAMIYPSIIILITVGAFIFLMTGIVPKLKVIFDEYDAQLPMQTRIMLGISGLLQKQGWLLGLVAAAGGFGAFRYIKTPKGKALFDKWLLKLPLFGSIIMKVNVARFARTFSSLTAAGVSVLDSLKVTSQAINNSIVKTSISQAAERVKNGQPISSSLEEQNILPPMLTQMIAVGEETGQVDKVLAKVADFYEKEVDRVVATLTSVIEPLMIVVLGGLVGLIVASVFGPISQLTNVVQ